MTLLIAIASLAATFAIGTLLHELAHAATAFLVGFKVQQINLGIGSRLFRLSIGGVPIEVRAVPGFGMVQLYPRLNWPRWRVFFQVAAGPGCDLLILIAILAVGSHLPSSEEVNAVVMASLVVQAFSLISNLVPHRLVLYHRVINNDGLRMLRLVLGKVDDNPYRSGYETVLRQHLSPGQSLPGFPERSEQIAWLVASRFLSKEEIAPETVVAFERLLAPDLPVCEEIVILDLLATSSLVAGDPATYADLDRWSARSMALAPNTATLKGTRGSVLIEIGRAEEGLALLADAEDGKAFNDCLVHAFRALGQFKLGNAEAAKQQFARAQALFKYREWQDLEIERIVQRIGRAIGELKASGS